MEDNREFTAQLLDELDQIASNTMLPMERRLVDTALWFHRNRGRVASQDLPRRVDFMEKTLDIVLEMFALVAQRIQASEGRGKSANLWMPNGMQVRF